MKKITYILLCASMVLAMTSCAKMQANRQISSLESLIEKVEKDGDSFTKEGWTDVANEFDEICGKMAQYDYTDEQMKEIARLISSLKTQRHTARRAIGNWSKHCQLSSRPFSGFVMQ